MESGKVNGENKANSISRDHKESESNTRINEIYSFSNKYVIYEDVEKIRKSICKIKSTDISKEDFGTGFFINYN